jgi:endo-1,4-beta-mannosidase
MFMWRQFDRSSIKEDMATISDLGFSCVRIFPLWEHFQPKPKIVPPARLDQLVEFLEMAGDRNLNVMVTLFTGHMNGLNWLPPWMLLASTERGQGSDKQDNESVR